MFENWRVFYKGGVADTTYILIIIMLVDKDKAS